MKKKSKVVLIVILLLAIIGVGGGGYVYMTYFNIPDDYVWEAEEPEGVMNPMTGKYMESLPERAFMVSTDNVGDAIPQYGISQADIVYEVPVEGSQSRLEAIYYSDIPKTVGPCRSVRPCIVDIAREWDAILVHDGWSPAAREYLSTGVVADLPAQKYGFYYRINTKSAPHNELADTKDILKTAKSAGLYKEQDIRSFKFMNEQEMVVLNGTEEEYLAKCEEECKEKLEHPKQGYVLPDLSGITFAENKKANEISVGYANCKSVYKYSKKKGTYTRSVNGGEYRDLNNNKKVKMSNVIVYRVSSSVTDHKGRLDIDMCAGGKAWVFTQGRVFECKWSRKNLDSPTIFTDADGNEVKLAPGKTWINIIDGSSSFSYK